MVFERASFFKDFHHDTRIVLQQAYTSELGPVGTQLDLFSAAARGSVGETQTGQPWHYRRVEVFPSA